ncbi:MAG TPA: hypothetical protein ENK02_06470, partial [Planctomycetes bacterium]|nr:hypothetical protein [Planctomycetota bacterium]
MGEGYEEIMKRFYSMFSLFLCLLSAHLWAQSGPLPQFIQNREVDWARLRYSNKYWVRFTPISYSQGDFDGDGVLDLVTANRNWGFIRPKGTNTFLLKDASFWKGDGEGFFELKPNNTPSHKAGSPGRKYNFSFGSCLAKGDFDGDGDLDVFVGKSDGTFLAGDRPFPDALLINNGKGVFTDEASKRLPKNLDITSACLAMDLDEDGDLDLIVGVSPGQPHAYINNGKGFFTDEGTKRFPKMMAGFSAGAIRAGDLDGDGDMDLVFAHGSHFAGAPKEPNLLLLNNGKGFFQLSPKGLPEIPDATNDVALGDVDGDGDLDIVTANWYMEDHLLINDGKGGFRDETKRRWKPKKQPTSWIVMGDVDQDGDLDIIFGGAFDCGWNRYCDIPWRYYVN